MLRLALLCLLSITIPVSVLMELAGDCDFALDQARPDAAICVHGHDESQDEQPGRCPTDHHGASRCGCSCHHSSIVLAASALAAPRLTGFVADRMPVGLPERRDAPPLRPPIAA